MSKHFYILKYDSDTGDWDLDYDSEEFAFPNGTIYDNDEWQFEYQDEGKYHPLAEPLSKRITAALDYLNKGVTNAGDN